MRPSIVLFGNFGRLKLPPKKLTLLCVFGLNHGKPDSTTALCNSEYRHGDQLGHLVHVFKSVESREGWKGAFMSLSHLILYATGHTRTNGVAFAVVWFRRETCTSVIWFTYKFSILKQQLLCSFHGPEFRVAGLGGSGSGSPTGLQSPWQLGLWSTESLPGAGRSDSKVALSQGCCRNSLLLFTWVCPWGLLKGPHDMTGSFPQTEPRRGEEQLCCRKNDGLA